MNRRARMRLIAVTVVILGAVIAFLVITGGGDASYSKTVDQVVSDKALVGQNIKVAGKVVAGSWDKKTDPMVFSIEPENGGGTNPPTVKIVYTGTTPSTFGDGVVAIVTGKLGDDNTITTSDMITKCPSKYQSAQGALTIDQLVGNPALQGKPVKATGYVVKGSIVQVPGTGDRIVVSNAADGSGKTLGIIYEGALPSGMKDGSQVVISGEIDASGKFTATDVALEQSQK